MFRILLFLFLLTAHHSFAQDYPFNNEAWWNRLVYDEQSPLKDFTHTDTCIIVVSNRYHTTDSLRFMSERTGDGTMLYFFVYAYKGQWHVLKKNSLEEAVQLIPKKNKDWVVYTEGMGKIFTSELNRGMMMASQYNVNVIMLDYPSITTTKNSLGNYLFSIKNARNAYKYHAPVLRKIKRLEENGELGNGKLSLFFHSMGNYLLRQTVKKKQLDGINGSVWADNIILNSACVPQHHHARWLDKVNFAKETYIQYNPDDKTLYWAELLSKKKQLGKRLRKPLSGKAHYVNFSGVVGKEHSYFLHLQDHLPPKELTKQYYSIILHGNTIDFSDKKYQPSAYRGIGFDILP